MIYQAVFPDEEFRTSSGHKLMDGDWGRARGFVRARHKCADEHTPYCVSNEYICACLGSAIGLPIPPFALTKYKDRAWRTLFSSLDFNPRGVTLPLVDPQSCMSQLPLWGTGVIVFDVWIANEDRHDENLAVDRTFRPKRLHVFDHGVALFGGRVLRGVERLQTFWDTDVITEYAVTGASEHCLLPYLTTKKYVDRWIDRIRSVPEWLIEEACRTPGDSLLKRSEVNMAVNFLMHRQKILTRIIYDQLLPKCGLGQSGRQRDLFDGR